MAIVKTPKSWSRSALTGASLAALSLGLTACGEDAPEPEQTPRATAEAPVGELGEGGEAGEGGEGGEAGGEFGIDPDLALTDPVVYRTAIEVIRAHYIAGLAALEMGERAAAAEMFAHPVSEIYVDLEPVIEERGGTLMMDELNRAAVLHFQGGDEAQIREAVAEVLAGLDANLEVAPEPETSEAAAHAGVLSRLLERAALQYALAAEEGRLEPWLDGYGLSEAAVRYGADALPVIAAADDAAAEAIAQALEASAAAYPGAAPPETFEIEIETLSERADAAAAAAARLQAG